jgi:hypothetical protein
MSRSVKNACSTGASVVMTHLPVFEAGGDELHQLRDGGQVPVIPISE